MGRNMKNYSSEALEADASFNRSAAAAARKNGNDALARQWERDAAKAEKELARVTGKLSNASFISKAPENVIAAEKEKEAKYSSLVNNIKESIAAIKK